MSTSYSEAQFGSSFEFPAEEDLNSWFTHLCEDQAAAAAPALLPVEFEAPVGAMADPRKRAAYQLVEGEASGAKRQRSPTSSRENSGGSNDGDHENMSEVAAAAGGRGGGRRLWVKERNHEWWDRMNSPACPEAEFRNAFRMSRATFEAVCEELGAVVAKEDTMLRAAIPVRQRVAVCIWRLATGEPLRVVSKRFGLGISTCHKLVLEVCAAIKAVLMQKVVQWPEAPDAAADVAARFKAASGIPNVVGAMYTTHIPIIAPKANVAAYYNRRHTERNQKTSYSITVQGVVDAAGVFTDVCIGWPGSMSDADVLEKSALYAQRGAAGLLQGQWVVGGAGYPLMDWLLVPYTHQNKTWSQHVFNERVDGVRGVARDAFQRLKARWGCLQKRTEVKLQDLPVVLGACCVLHNICERAGDAVDPGFQLFDDDMLAENPVRSQVAASARDNIAHNLLHNSSDAGAGFLLK
ncbi:protein ANTAGONIST OF LIKE HETEROCHROMATIN PROTEIN 1-like [Phragmites australis]|uniref:protein ANTAGONIST OF LIKE HETEROCHROMATIN PROTEIN 1-like n=1 Tax=Phragmites australis TaxID=29695 RepID=UPI002D789719|nr:protein ANTAGONIST OF LIKE HETEROCHROMATIN PROTEIN 1-like [Phragmites australis]